MIGRAAARAVVVAALVVAIAVAGAGAAAAQVDTARRVLDEAATSLRRDPLYVHPDAERGLSPGEQERVRDAVVRASTPLFVAILPASAVDEVGGDPSDLPAALGRAVGIRGTYAVVAGGSFRAASNSLRPGVAGDAATAAFRDASGAGTAAVLLTFVERVDAAAAATPSGRSGEPAAGRRDGSGEAPARGSSFPLLAFLALGGGALWLWSRRSRSRADAQAAAELAADRELLRAELSVLADDVLRLEPEVALNEEAHVEYDAAVLRYRTATAALDAADEQIDLVRVERLVREANYAMARTRARLAGRPLPLPPDELQRPGRHGEPPVELDEREMPVYAGYGGGWYGGGGWFGGGGGLLSGLLLGQMLGGFGGFGGFGGGRVGGDGGGGWGDGGGGGDWGGGDFGGGDAGGGDW